MHLKSHAIVSLTLATVFAGSAALIAAPRDDERTDKEQPRRAEIGKPAPNFTLKDLDGKEHSLSDYKGKTVILEWFNAECPYVVRLYRTGALKTMGNDLNRKDDYVWLAINSNMPGSQGAGLEKNQHYKKEYGIEYPVLLDEPGVVGRLYDARTTPHMYIINAEGILVYSGAIDNDPFGRLESDEHVNYVQVALAQLRNGETVEPSTTRPYGCTVKYADAAAGQRGASEGRERRPRGEGREGRPSDGEGRRGGRTPRDG
jgi:peroxiredoxin